MAKKIYVVKFEPYRIEFSDGTVITSNGNPFDEDIIEAIMDYNGGQTDENNN